MIFVGQELEHDLDFGIDLDGVTTLQIRYTKPGGVSTTNLSAARQGETDRIRHILTTAELDTAGEWKANAYADFGGGKIIIGETVRFWVYAIGELQ